MNKESPNRLDDLIKILRCPHCSTHRRQGQLGIGDGNWLVCQESGCGRKYPIYNSLAIMLTEESDFFHFRKGLEGADLRVHNQLNRKYSGKA